MEVASGRRPGEMVSSCITGGSVESGVGGRMRDEATSVASVARARTSTRGPKRYGDGRHQAQAIEEPKAECPKRLCASRGPRTGRIGG